MARAKFDNEVAKKILVETARLSAVTVLVAAVVIMPGIGVVAKEIANWYQKQNHKKRFAIRKTFKELRKARLLESKELPDGSLRLVLSEKGKKKILQYKFEELKLKEPKKWDGQWRFVIFDLPKQYRRERELWRRKLKHLGFYQLQKSVWVHAFPCRGEIDFVSEYLNLSPHVRIIESIEFDGSEEVRNFFFQE